MALTIKDHIEAGHYPKDEKGRALVPTNYGVVTICATDVPSHMGRPILGFTSEGWRAAWYSDGVNKKTRRPTDWDLLPPTPRKVEVVRWAIFRRKPDDDDVFVGSSSREPAKVDLGPSEFVVRLTGSYETPWDDKP